MHGVVAATGLLVLAPLFLLVSAVIKVHDGGPVFFRQTRVGAGGRPFTLWKFRTMVPDAEQQGIALTVGADDRITDPGRWLRRFKIDELPQLLNVVRGDMALVGPRPEVPRYVRFYDDAQRRVLDLRPGITDPASLTYLDESALLAETEDPERHYVGEIMPKKIEINLKYASRASVWSDLAVVLDTLTRIFGLRGGGNTMAATSRVGGEDEST